MKLNIELLSQLFLVAVLSGGLSTLLVQKLKEQLAWLVGFWVIVLSLALNFGLAWLVIVTLVELGDVYKLGIIALVGLVGFVNAQLLYSYVKDQWQFFKDNKIAIPQLFDLDDIDEVTDHESEV